MGKSFQPAGVGSGPRRFFRRRCLSSINGSPHLSALPFPPLTRVQICNGVSGSCVTSGACHADPSIPLWSRLRSRDHSGDVRRLHLGLHLSRLADRDDPATRLVAERIIAHAEHGVTNRSDLYGLVIAEFQQAKK
jgi:hypothetical protein